MYHKISLSTFSKLEHFIECKENPLKLHWKSRHQAGEPKANWEVHSGKRQVGTILYLHSSKRYIESQLISISLRQTMS